MRVKLVRPYKALGRMWLAGEVIDLPEHLARALELEGSGAIDNGQLIIESGPKPHAGETPTLPELETPEDGRVAVETPERDRVVSRKGAKTPRTANRKR